MLNESETALIERYNATKLEQAALEAKAAEMRRAWISDGVSVSRSERATLESRIASLRMERMRLRVYVVPLREREHQEQKNKFLHALIAQCHAAGCSALVDAARRESQAPMEPKTADQGDAYAR